jgi:hypothetical protein
MLAATATTPITTITAANVHGSVGVNLAHEA